jgi:hypothetical protein
VLDNEEKRFKTGDDDDDLRLNLSTTHGYEFLEVITMTCV